MRKIVIVLFIANAVAVIALALIGWLIQNEAITIMTQMAVACLLTLIIIVFSLDDLLQAATAIGRDLRHPRRDALVLIASGTLLAIISANISSPFAASLGLLIELIVCMLAWQFGHQPRRDQLQHWNPRR